jgi:predicted deacetylase
MEADRRLASGPVITWASRSRSRRASSLAAALVLRRALRRCRVARVGLHPGDTRHESLLASIRATLKALSATHTPANYVDLLS